MTKVHYYWIDFMKAIGMYLIVAGHFFPKGHEYIYVFSVPLFFIISGYLSKKELDTKIFWKKLFYNLVLPCVIILLFVHLIDIGKGLCRGNFIAVTVPKHIINCIIGIHGEGVEAGGVDVCWFIYTLIICKIINQFVYGNKGLQTIVIIICFATAVYYNVSNMNLHNAIINTSLAYPMFAIGGGKLFDKVKHACYHPLLSLLIFFSCLIIVVLVGNINGAPWMYNNQYGRNIFLFLIGGVAGTIALYMLCYPLNNVHSESINIISRGSIVILGFHILIVKILLKIPNHLHGVFYDIINNHISVYKYVMSLVIIIFFIPIICLCENHFPVLLGQRVKK